MSPSREVTGQPGAAGRNGFRLALQLELTVNSIPYTLVVVGEDCRGALCHATGDRRPAAFRFRVPGCRMPAHIAVEGGA